MYHIKNIRLENIKGFKELNISVSDENKASRKRTIILGKNGTCKSTLLRCIAIGLCDAADGNALIAEPIGRLVSEDASTATIELELISHEGADTPRKIITKLENKNDKDSIVDQAGTLPHNGSIFVCGYGVGRSSTGPETGRAYRIIDSVYTLFQYEQTLIDTELTLRRLKDYLGTDLYVHAKSGIKKALELSPEDDFELPKGGGVVFSGPTIGKHIPLEGLADGYRITFSWILDLYGWAMRANNVTSTGGIGGILLVDELEQHIHPSLQTNILSRLSDLFPEMQILATTHSPLVALGALPQELIALRRDGKSVVSEENIPDFRGYSAEDMLVDSRLFNSKVYSKETNRKLDRYRELASISVDKRSQTQTEELKTLACELGTQHLPVEQETPLIQELKKFREKYDL